MTVLTFVMTGVPVNAASATSPEPRAPPRRREIANTSSLCTLVSLKPNHSKVSRIDGYGSSYPFKKNAREETEL